ncbi:MAG: HNH endonuclease [Flavobacterium sp.]|nr:MAG: HNH endonuclease [Flavobacterium sp.]
MPQLLPEFRAFTKFSAVSNANSTLNNPSDLILNSIYLLDLFSLIKFFFKRKDDSYYVPSTSTEQPIVVEEPRAIYESNKPTITERAGLVTSRVGQGAYRKSIIFRWEFKCAVTGFDKLEVLIASHILPWALSDNNQRLDVHNGLLLSPTYDALFDRHLISFENNGKIILSDSILPQAFHKLGVTGKERITELSEHNFEYLSAHRNSIR